MISWITPCECRGIESPKLDYNLVCGVRIDISVVDICRLILGLDFLAPASMLDFDFIMKFL